MNGLKTQNGVAERLRIQERALADLADALKRHEVETAAEREVLRAEVKALTLFLSRNYPGFKKEFAELQQKVT